MDLFRHETTPTSKIEKSSGLVPDDESEDMVRSIEQLVDSDEEGIFDDDEELTAPSKSVTGSASGASSTMSSSLVPKSPILSIPTTVQHGAMVDVDVSSRSSRQSLRDRDLSSSDEMPFEGDDDDDDDDKGSDSAEDYTDDEDEGQDGYKPGGYHPVKEGEIYNQR